MLAEAGRIDMGGSKRQKEVTVLTSSANPAVKAAIQDPIHEDCYAGGCFRSRVQCNCRKPLNLEQVCVLQVGISRFISRIDRVDFDRCMNAGGGDVVIVERQKPFNAGEVSLHIGNHHVPHSELDNGVSGIDFPDTRRATSWQRHGLFLSIVKFGEDRRIALLGKQSMSGVERAQADSKIRTPRWLSGGAGEGDLKDSTDQERHKCKRAQRRNIDCDEPK
jgi:hypothetical protein